LGLEAVSDHPLAAMPQPYPAFPKGHLEFLADKETDESEAWNSHDAISALNLLKSQEHDIDQALSMAEICVDRASEEGDTQAHGFFRGLVIHLETESKLVCELWQIALSLNPPEILDDSQTRIDPPTALAGSTFKLYYHIHNAFSEPVSAWLGATITKDDGSGTQFDDPLHDTARTIASGDGVYERQFTVPDGAPAGSYGVSWGLHSGRVIGEGMMWDIFTREATLTVVAPGTDIEVTSTVDQDIYNPLETIHLSADLLPGLTGASVTYVTKDKAGVVVKSGTCSDNGGGRYSASFSVPNTTGDYTIEVTASMTGCADGTDSTGFSVEHTGGSGHDVGIETVYWDHASAIRPYSPYDDIIASIGEHIIVQAVTVRNYGDYRENVEVIMELAYPDGSLVVDKSDSVYLSVGPHDTLMYSEENLDVSTSGMDGGEYSLRIKTVIAGDSNPANNVQTWQIIVVSRTPPPGHLPFRSYKWYLHRYNDISESTTALVASYTIRVTYLSDTFASFELSRPGWSLNEPQIQQNTGPYDFDGGDLIVYLDGSSKGTGGKHLLFFYVGVVDDAFEQDNPDQIVYGYGGATPPAEVPPSRYQSQYDFYLPAGWTASTPYLKGYNPLLSETQIGYQHIKVTCLPSYSGPGGTSSRYNGTRVFAGYQSFVSDGKIDNYYIVVPRASAPPGDYNLLIIQHRELSIPGDGTYELGYAHSVRMTVVQYRDVSLSEIGFAPSMVFGNEYDITVGVDNKGDIEEDNVVVGLAISGPAGYSETLEETVSTLVYGGSRTATFRWDTDGLGDGSYTFVATTTIPDDANTVNSTVVAVNMLYPPPPPPRLNVVAVFDHDEYPEGGVVDIDIAVSIDGPTAIEGAAVRYTLSKDTQTLHAGTATEVGGGTYSATFHGPLSPDVYTCRITANKLGYREGEMDVFVEVVDTTEPSVPHLLRPANGARVNPIALEFDWVDATDAGSGISEYELQISLTDTFAAPDVDTIASDSSWSSAYNLNDGEYYWHVRAIDNAGNVGGWSSAYMFTLDSAFPDIYGEGDGQVNFRDFAVLANQWRETCTSTNWVEDDPCNIYIDGSNSRLYWLTDTQQRSAYDTYSGTLAVGDAIEFMYKYWNHRDSSTRQRVWFGFTDAMPFTEPFADNFIGGAAVNNYGKARFKTGIRRNGEWIYVANFDTAGGVPVAYYTRIEILFDTQFRVTITRDGSSEVVNETLTGNLSGLHFEKCAVWNKQLGSGSIQGWFEGHLDYIEHKTAAGGYGETFDGSSTYCEGADLDGNGTVDSADYEIFAQHWLEGITP